MLIQVVIAISAPNLMLASRKVREKEKIRTLTIESTMRVVRENQCVSAAVVVDAEAIPFFQVKRRFGARKRWPPGTRARFYWWAPIGRARTSATPESLPS